MKRLLLLLLAMSLVLVSHTSPTPVQSSAPKDSPGFYILEVVDCPEATACVMNVVGEPGLLFQKVAVYVGRLYQAPSANYYGCKLEHLKGKVAAAFLEETLRNADFIVLLKPRKMKDSPWLIGDLLVDGEDVTVLMFRMNVAVPNGIKVDWCEKRSRRLEV